MSEPSAAISDAMQACAEEAIAHSRAIGEQGLDYSIGSLERVEAILTRLYDETPKNFISKLFGRVPSAAEIEMVAKAYGGYIGEVIRRTHGGSWELNSEVTDVPVVALRIGEGVIFPPAKVYKRLTNGPEDSVWFYYQAFAKDWPSAAV